MTEVWDNSGSNWKGGSAGEWNGADATANDQQWNEGKIPATDSLNNINGNAGFDAGNMGSADAAGFAEGGCRNCGEEGHFARDQPKRIGPCFNCGEEGHSKVECVKPRVFKGTCNICSEEGHPAAKCPSKPKFCTRCKVSDAHDTKDCKSNFYLDLNGVADVPEVVAWAKLADASADNDIDDFKDALRMLQKAAPELTYPAIEKKLRAQDNKFHLIALKKDIGGGYTLVNLQGEPEKTFCVTVMKSANCQRPNMVDKWPASPQENLERLANAGIPLEKGISYCRNCEQFGHAARDCDQEHVPVEAAKVECALCGAEGHRVRDCTEERKKPREPRTCKICESEDHIAKDCDQKPERPPMVCRNCDQGHKASECEAPRKIKCNNCDEEGHIGRDCMKPRDWSRVTCRHCGEKGHASANRCAPGAAKMQDGDAAGDANRQTHQTNNGGEWDGDNAATTSTNAGWDNAPAAASGNW